MKIVDSMKRKAKSYWHRTRHSFKARFSKSGVEYTIELLGLIAWALLILQTKEINLLVAVCIAVMFIARMFPVAKAFWKGDKEKLNHLKKRRIESNTCIREINECLIDSSRITDEKIKEIRRKLLNSIVDALRAYRNDLPGNKIFSNLLLPADGDYLKVAIRNAPDRGEGTKYKKMN